MRHSHIAWLASLALGSLAVFYSQVARAAEPAQETADGVAACRAFREKNEKELHAWEATQPAQPFQYKPPDTVLDAPWMPFLSWFGQNLDLIAASFLPAIGAQARDALPATTVSWPLSFGVGPMYACSRKNGTYVVNGHRAHRIMLEPGLVLAEQGFSITVRPGYRFLYHPTDWVVGFGAGLGSTLELTGNKEPFRASIGPELVLHFGHCCERSYFTLALRYDYFAEGRETHILGANLGYVYF